MLQEYQNDGICSTRKKSVKGFTLIELLLSTMLGAMVIGVVAFTFANMAGSFAEQPTTGQTFDWDNARSIPYSPAYSQLPQAFNLQAEISDALQATTNAAGGLVSRNTGNPVTAVYVVSSDMGENLPAVPAGNASDVSSIAAISGIAAAQVASSAEFVTLLNPLNAGTGYSIYFISDDSHVNMAVHCRVTTSGNDTIYTVKTYSDGAFCPSLSYAFGVRNTNSSVAPSARHIKLRTDATWGLDEDVGTQVVFPDPSVVAYQIIATDNARAFSRFAVFLPVNP
jgi:Tfp pilus assembly protein PilW